MKRFAGLLLAGCVVAVPGAAAASWSFDGDVGIVHETNVGLAQKARDVKSDSALVTSVAPGLAFILDDRNVLSLAADVSGAGYAQLRGLDNLTLGLTPAFRTKFGLGYEAPWLRVWGSGARLEYDDPVRDGWRYRLGAGVGKSFGERCTASPSG